MRFKISLKNLGLGRKLALLIALIMDWYVWQANVPIEGPITANAGYLQWWLIETVFANIL